VSLSTHRVRRQLVGAAAISALAGGLLLAGALPASAHVHVEADDPESGGFSVLTFRVPNESDTAGTVRVAVTLPTDHPFLYVSTKPVPGWTVSAPQEKLPAAVEVEGTTVTKAVRTVTWTAEKGTRIEPGQYQEFAISVGPLPDSTAAAPTTIMLPVVQTYSDGKTVNWDQKTPPSGEEPENPAPEFTVAPAAADEHHDTSSPSGGASGAPSSNGSAGASAGAQSGATDSGPDQGTATTHQTDTVARVLGGAGLVLGAAALGIALVGRRRRGSA
jgi:periplasmic copper chaperone A